MIKRCPKCNEAFPKIPKGKKLRHTCPSGKVTTYQSKSDDGDFGLSMVMGMATGSGIVGGLLGGDMIGGMIGSSMSSFGE